MKGSIEATNVKIKNVNVAVDKLRDVGIYMGGMAVASKAIKSSSVPVGTKLGITLSMGCIFIRLLRGLKKFR